MHDYALRRVLNVAGGVRTESWGSHSEDTRNGSAEMYDIGQREGVSMRSADGLPSNPAELKRMVLEFQF